MPRRWKEAVHEYNGVGQLEHDGEQHRAAYQLTEYEERWERPDLRGDLGPGSGDRSIEGRIQLASASTLQVIAASERNPVLKLSDGRQFVLFVQSDGTVRVTKIIEPKKSD